MNTYSGQHDKAKPGESLVGIMVTRKTDYFEYDVRFTGNYSHKSCASHVMIVDQVLADLVK